MLFMFVVVLAEGSAALVADAAVAEGNVAGASPDKRLQLLLLLLGSRLGDKDEEDGGA
jgi:hypothetical protein